MQREIQLHRRIADEQDTQNDDGGHQPIPVVAVWEGGGSQERDGVAVEDVHTIPIIGHAGKQRYNAEIAQQNRADGAARHGLHQFPHGFSTADSAEGFADGGHGGHLTGNEKARCRASGWNFRLLKR